MGCCVSTNTTSNSSLPSSRKSHDSPKPLTSRDNPKPCNRAIEKEKVKEVLSETPKWNPTTIAKSKPQKPFQNTTFEKFRELGKVDKKILSIYKAEDKAWSLSETMSTATSITNKREEREKIRKRIEKSHAKMQKNRSFPSENGSRRERMVYGTKNVGSMKFVQCRDQMGQKIDSVGTRRRRASGENSFRRTRSLTTGVGTGAARSVLGRSPSARKTIQSPAWVRTGPPENGGRKKEIQAREGKWPFVRETLENPLVSLECFIFI
ncbi:uncharacterized protein LOC113859897 [Abrus precatorius]|uniref:Uncharacterized protein LOC113859897 n=1 Tax=Abrus precatorius TaxID=3816 RepID=A0A8B8KWM6_ABRPR|nr:uncharacterized protein LOC113859897 [Abrus precatorius]